MELREEARKEKVLVRLELTQRAEARDVP